MGAGDMADKARDMADKAKEKLGDATGSEEESGEGREHRDRDVPGRRPEERDTRHGE